MVTSWRCDTLTTGIPGTQNLSECPYNKQVIHTPLMITDTTQDKQIRRSIIKQVENMDLRLLQRIAYEVRCEELGLYADSWKLYSEEN